MEQLVDGDLEGDAAVLLEANLVPAAARSVRDDRVAAAVAWDDVQIVGLSVAGLKSDTAVLMDVFDSTGNGCSLCGGEGSVDGVGDNPVGPVVRQLGKSVLCSCSCVFFLYHLYT